MNTEAARVQMVSQQVRTWEVLDPDVLDAMSALARERFVPEAYRDVAYADIRIPLAHGQTMLAPKVVGRIAQCLELKRTDRVLEIGTGSGYLTACLAQLAAQITSLDIHADLTERAGEVLASSKIDNVELRTDDAFAGQINERFDAIAITGSLPVYDERFEKLLRVGGRLYVAVGHSPVMEASVITRISEQQTVATSVFETDVPALINATDPVEFSF